MANELELLTINDAGDSWVDLNPDEVSTGYQAQNTNIEGRTNGLESLYIEISGTDAVFNPSGVIDDNGAPMVVKTQVTLAVPSGQRFVRVIDGGSPTTRSLQIVSAIGVYDESKNGYYTSGDRMLNWSLNDISGSLKSYKILAPLHAHILGDALFDGNITQTSGVTSLKETTISTDLKFLGSQHRIMSDQTTATGAFIELRGGDVGVSDSQINFKTNGTTTRYQISKLGNSIFGGGVDNTIDLIQAAEDLDESFAFGRGKLGYAGNNDQFMMSHIDNHNLTDFGIKFASTNTQINAKLGGFVYTKINNVNVITVAGTAIDLLKPVTIETALNSGLDITDGVINGINYVSGNQGGSYVIGTTTNHPLVLGTNNIFPQVILDPSGRFIINAIDDTVNQFQVGGSGIFSGALTADSVNTGYGDNDVVPEYDIFDHVFTSILTNTLPSISIKQTATMTYKGGVASNIYLPATGTYIYHWTFYDFSLGRLVTDSVNTPVAGGALIIIVNINDELSITYKRIT